MFDFLSKFFGRETSSATAKERLRLVLLSDHLSLAPDVVEALKRDLVQVISRYVEVDAANCDVTFEQQDKQVAMLANIPILAMNGRPTPPPVPPPPPASEPPPSFGNAAGASAAVAIELEPDVTVTEPPPEPEPHAPAQPRRKRRKRRGGGVAMNASPQPG